jgi:hypothetical protein
MMDARTWSLAIALTALACAPRDNRGDQQLLQEGRMYTTWLYGSEFNKLWDRFSPEMRQSFGSVGDLASFTGRALKQLGSEQGKVDEQVKDGEPFRVYSRSASFEKAPHRMLIQWSLAKDGAVTGLVVRPVAAESGTQ